MRAPPADTAQEDARETAGRELVHEPLNQLAFSIPQLSTAARA
jgi:hypothetical protein